MHGDAAEQGGSPAKIPRLRTGPRAVADVELRGFEPLTPSMRTRCATGLRYSPAGPRPHRPRSPSDRP